MENQNFDQLNFNTITEYTCKRNMDYNYVNYENEHEETFSEIIYSDQNNEFILKKRFSFKLDFQIEDWVNNY